MPDAATSRPPNGLLDGSGSFSTRERRLSASHFSRAVIATVAGLSLPTVMYLRPTATAETAVSVTLVDQELEEARKQAASRIDKLLASLTRDSLEDGVKHPAEEVLAGYGSHRRLLADHLIEWISDEHHAPSLRADLVRLFGRTDAIDNSARARLVRAALSSRSAAIRDAAIQAVECWGGAELISILSEHHEPNSWIKSYITKVIEEA